MTSAPKPVEPAAAPNTTSPGSRTYARIRALLSRLKEFRLDDGAGLPAAEPGLERAARAVTWAATLFMLGVCLWEIAAPFGAGHYAAATAVASGGENIWKFGIAGAVPRFSSMPPAPSEYYCHHPWGTFWTAAIFVGIFGHHDWVCRLPAALMSVAMPVLLHRTGRALYGPIAAALSAAAFVVTPIALAYANFFALEVPVMFAMVLASFGYVRFAATSRPRFAVLTVLGLGLGAAYDWPGFAFAGLVLGGLYLRLFWLRRWFSPVDFERAAKLWATAAALVAALGLFHLLAFAELGRFSELMMQGRARASGSNLPLEQVLETRRYWLALAFTPLAIALGKIAAPILLYRATVGRRDAELFPAAALITAILQYVVWKQGADIHFFWPHYFALYFAFALGLLGHVARVVVERLLVRAGRPELVQTAGYGVLAAGLSLALMILPDGLRALEWARKTGGRFNEKGLIIHPDLDKAAAFDFLSRALPEDASLGVDGSMKPSYWMDFTLKRVVTGAPPPRNQGRPTTTHFALDPRFSSGATVRALGKNYAVQAFGPYLVADLEAPGGPLAGYALPRREPRGLERFFVSSSHALYSVVPDPFWTWELGEHFEKRPNPAPAVPPRTRSDVRSAHNLAVASGNGELAAHLAEELVSGCNRSVRKEFTSGVTLLGACFERGASDVLTLYFETSEAQRADHRFTVSSIVEHAPRWSLVPKDELVWDVGMPFTIPATLWRPGFVYESATEILKRPGKERYLGAFRGPGAPQALDGKGEIELLVLE